MESRFRWGGVGWRGALLNGSYCMKRLCFLTDVAYASACLCLSLVKRY